MSYVRDPLGPGPAPHSMNLEKRIDAAGRYIRSLDVRIHAMASACSNSGWIATVATDSIGGAGATFSRCAESPADAIDAVLRDAAEWVQKQRENR